MKNELEKYFKLKLNQMERLYGWPERSRLYEQAFGAIELAMQIKPEEEEELVKMWENHWKKKFEKVVYGVDWE